MKAYYAPLLLTVSVLLLTAAADRTPLAPPTAEKRESSASPEKKAARHQAHEAPQACPSVTVIVKQVPAKIPERITAVVQQQPYDHWWDSPNAPEWALFVLTVPYVLVTIGLFVMTKKAANAAKASADAASESNRQNRELGERELRAYVNLSGGKILNIANPNERRVRITINNFGRTPAYGVRFMIGVYTRELPLESALPDLPMHLPMLATDVLAPNRVSTLELSMSALDPGEERELQEVRAAIYVWGRVTYTDAFGVDRWTNFRLFCAGDALPDGKLYPHQEGNSSN